jgi:hypothetical protein
MGGSSARFSQIDPISFAGVLVVVREFCDNSYAVMRCGINY